MPAVRTGYWVSPGSQKCACDGNIKFIDLQKSAKKIAFYFLNSNRLNFDQSRAKGIGIMGVVANVSDGFSGEASRVLVASFNCLNR